MPEKTDKIKVEIFGTNYLLKGGDEPEYMKEIASYVDNKMKEVQEATDLISPLKIAILAALNIADELHQAVSGKKRGAVSDVMFTKKAIELIDKIEKELE